MGKLKKLFHPYAFRNRTMVMLLASSFVAASIAMVSSFLMNSVNIREEQALNQYAVAVYLLELDQKTELSSQEIVGIVDDELLSVRVSPVDASDLQEDVFQQLQSKLVLTVSPSPIGMPATYVQLDDAVVSIMPSRSFNIFLTYFVRVSSSVTTFLMAFVLMAWMTSRSIAKPVTMLTKATRHVSEGDFSVKLPEDVPGEVGELMSSFNSMTDALGRTSYLQKDFISSISHEFRTPIASIRGFAKLLQMEGVDEAAKKEYVELIAQESDRLSRLSETLLRLSALEQQAAPASLSTFRLDEQIRQVILRLEPAWASREINWRLEMQEVTIRSDSELLTQVWINLIQNAVKFSAEGSAIEISVTLEGKSHALVSIRDHGVGMDEKTISRIFDRFYQGDRSRSKQGVGLGLCLVKRILDILHGGIQVKSAPGEGSTFTVRLPLNTDHYATMEARHHE